MFFDTHAHLDDQVYDQDREQMIQRIKEAGVKYVCNVGYDLPSSRRSFQLAHKYEFIYAAVGVHPHDVLSVNENTWVEIKEMCKDIKVVAIGEIGLDYYRDLSPRENQQEIFRRQINLARELGKPVIIHDRDAHGDVMSILKEEKASDVGGILHCFSGSWEMARECLEMGFYISFAGPVTFKNAGKVKEISTKVPLDKLLIETDSPYLTPEPYRGKRNESSYVVHVAREIANLREIDLQELGRIATENALKVFNIK